MEDVVEVAEVEAAEGHEHPGLDVGRLEDEHAVLDDGLEVRVEVLEHEVEVGFGGKDVEQLAKGSARGMLERRGGADLDDVRMLELLEEFDLADGRHVEPIFELAGLPLFPSSGSGSSAG